MTQMLETSLEAYDLIKLKLSQKRAEVLKVIEDNEPVCDFQIAYILGWPINCVTGRRNELEKLGLIGKSHKGTSPTGRAAYFWKVNKPNTLF